MSGLVQAVSQQSATDPLLLNSKPLEIAGKLNALVYDAAHNVPFYASRFDRHPADTEARLDALQRLRPVTKSELVAEPTERLTHRHFDPAKLYTETTTGSSGQPFTLAMDRGYLLRRNLRFLRALLDVGYRLGQRMMLVSRSGTATGRSRLGWYQQSLTQSSEALLDALQRIKPRILYGCVTPLRLMAEQARAHGNELHRPRLVITTGEVLHPATEKLLSNAFDAPVADFYGSTEMGLVAWRRPGASSYHTFDRCIVTELLPYPAMPGWHELVLTNLELRSMPMLRLKVGDLAEVKLIDGAPRIVGFEGREIDVLWRGDRAVSPYAVTGEFEAIPGLARFQLTQCSLQRFEVTLQCDDGYELSVSRRMDSVLHRLFGDNVKIDRVFVEQIPVQGLRKFQPIRSLVQG